MINLARVALGTEATPSVLISEIVEVKELPYEFLEFMVARDTTMNKSYSGQDTTPTYNNDSIKIPKEFLTLGMESYIMKVYDSDDGTTELDECTISLGGYWNEKWLIEILSSSTSVIPIGSSYSLNSEFNYLIGIHQLLDDQGGSTQYFIKIIKDRFDYFSDRVLNDEVSNNSLFTNVPGDIPEIRTYNAYSSRCGTYLHSWKYVTENKIILGLNIMPSTDHGSDMPYNLLTFYDYDEVNNLYVRDEVDVLDIEINHEPGVGNLIVLIKSTDQLEVTNFSPVIHNLAYRPHRLMDKELANNEFIGKLIDTKLIDSYGKDTRNEVNYFSENDELIIDEFYDDLMIDIDNYIVKDFDEDRQYEVYGSTNKSLGNVYAEFLGGIHSSFSSDTGSDKSPIDAELDLKCSYDDTGGFSNIITTILDYYQLTSDDGWSPINGVPYLSGEINDDGLENELINPYKVNHLSRLQVFNYTQEYRKNDRVIYKEKIYKSLKDHNQFNYPEGSKFWISI